MSIRQVQILEITGKWKHITQSSHGLAAKNVVRWNGSAWVKADNGADNTLSDPPRLVLSVTDTNNFVLGLEGIHTLTGHGLNAGRHYLSTNGGLTQTEPARSNPILDVIDTNTIQILDYEPVVGGAAPTANTSIAFDMFAYDANTATGRYAGTGFTVPSWMNGKNVATVIVGVDTPGTTNTLTVLLKRKRISTVVDVLSTGVTVNSGDYTASDGVIDTANDDLQTGDLLYPHISAIHTTPAKGCTVTVTVQ